MERREADEREREGGAASESINKCGTSFTFFNYLPFDMQAEHSVINISGDNGVATN